jgi:hypothetical protein
VNDCSFVYSYNVKISPDRGGLGKISAYEIPVIKLTWVEPQGSKFYENFSQTLCTFGELSKRGLSKDEKEKGSNK